MAAAIPFVDLATEHAELRAEIDAAIARVIDSGHFILGPEVAALEGALAPICGAAHVIGVSSGTDALLMALMALGIGPGDEVVTTPFSFFATAGVIARVGARAVFADIEPETFNLDPAHALAAIGAKTKAVIPVHLYGRPATLPATDHPIVEDAAQSIGASPLRGTCACLSFFPTKNLGAMGDGGAIVTSDAALADKLRILRVHGSKPKYYNRIVGGNFRLDSLQAAILRVKLPHLARRTAARRAHADRYRTLFASARVPAELVVPADHPQHIYNQFTVRVPQRDDLRAFLQDRGIPSEIYYPVPLHLQEAFADLGYAAGSMPHAERAAAEALSLPISPSLTDEQAERVVAAIEVFYA